MGRSLTDLPPHAFVRRRCRFQAFRPAFRCFVASAAIPEESPPPSTPFSSEPLLSAPPSRSSPSAWPSSATLPWFEISSWYRSPKGLPDQESLAIRFVYHVENDSNFSWRVQK